MALTTNPSNTYDPANSATALTDKYTVDIQKRITEQTKAATATSAALLNMRMALTSFSSSMLTLTGKTMVAQGATLSDTSVGSATAAATATPGTYSVFVEKVATKNQIALSGLSGTPVPADGDGTLNIKLANNTNFTVDLSKANTDGDTTLSPKEIAAAINAEPKNSGVTASVITIGGVAKLVLSSSVSGEEGAVTLDTSAMAASDLKTALSVTPNQLIAAQDAVIWVGGKPTDPTDTSNRIKQSSNTFSNIDGVKMTFTKAQASSDAPVTITVALDVSATTTNAQSFVTAYNKLKAVLDGLTDPGDPAKEVAGGTFSSDNGVRVLRDQLMRALRESGSGSLATFGITSQRNGTLALDATRLEAAVKSNPTGLDKAIGNNSGSAPSGIVGKLDKYIDTWTSTTGQLSQRETSLTKTQKALETRQTKFEDDYKTMYDRYKAQFTKLQTFQAQMSQTTDMFDALFGNDKSS